MQFRSWMLALCLIVSSAACVTVNIYFPEAAAEKAADEILEDLHAPEQPPPPKPQSRRSSQLVPMLLALLTVAMPTAEAAESGPDLKIDTPEIRTIRARMKKAYAAVRPYYQNGWIGLGRDGYPRVRDPASIPPAHKARVQTGIQQLSQIQRELYRAIARANGHPEWERDIEATFAARWPGTLEPGWWYQDARGRWVRK